MYDLHKSFRLGAETLVLGGFKYRDIHRAHGIGQADWDILVQEEPWTPQQVMGIRNVLAQVVEVALTIAGMPPVPLPGQYVAAVIAIIVQPANRFLACTKVPDTFDAVAASGLQGMSEIQPMKREQLFALTMAYSGGFGGEPSPKLPSEVLEMKKKGAEK